MLALAALGMVVVEVVPRLAGGDEERAPSGDDLVLRFGAGAEGEPVTAPTGGPPSAAAATAEGEVDLEGLVQGVDYHVVRKGETLGAIAAAYYGDESYAAELAEYNHIADADRIDVGVVIWLWR